MQRRTLYGRHTDSECFQIDFGELRFDRSHNDFFPVNIRKVKGFDKCAQENDVGAFRIAQLSGDLCRVKRQNGRFIF